MRIGVSCESPLLQRSLELFLQGHLSSLKSCDCIVKDHESDANSTQKPVLRIGSDKEADIIKPFSKSQLFYALEQFYKAQHPQKTVHEHAVKAQSDHVLPTYESMDFELLERRIDTLTQEYKQGIIRAIKAFYGE